ncbi:MAG: hypothetical protein F8N37_04645 [Telmatospirillum sp.]|nr:hypothetical protein [Telmatospirillum sp.]
MTTAARDLHRTRPWRDALLSVAVFLLFWVLLVPLGLVFRLLGWDPLGRKPRPGAASYWRKADPGPVDFDSTR